MLRTPLDRLYPRFLRPRETRLVVPVDWRSCTALLLLLGMFQIRQPFPHILARGHPLRPLLLRFLVTTRLGSSNSSSLHRD